MPHQNANIDRIGAGDYRINENERKVYIVSRFVGGARTAWAANAAKSLFGGGPFNAPLPAAIDYPNPNYHWAICVGDWYHQLQATNNKNYYENDKYSWTGGWKSVEVGITKYNDVAIASAGNQAIMEMAEDYDLVYNNCQTFSLKLADKICRNGRKKVFTSWSRTTRQLGFVPGLENGLAEKGEEIEVAFVQDGIAHIEQMAAIEKIMQDNTPTLTEEEIKAGKLDLPEGFVDKMPNEKLKENDGEKAT